MTTKITSDTGDSEDGSLSNHFGTVQAAACIAFNITVHSDN